VAPWRVDVLVHLETLEIGEISQGLENGTVQVRAQVHNLRPAVLEPDSEPVIAGI
jgi:hypothetical protein